MVMVMRKAACPDCEVVAIVDPNRTSVGATGPAAPRNFGQADFNTALRHKLLLQRYLVHRWYFTHVIWLQTVSPTENFYSQIALLTISCYTNWKYLTSGSDVLRYNHCSQFF